jgi:hypothetical protein
VSVAPLPLPPWETAPRNHCTGGGVGPRTSLKVIEKRKIIASAGNRTLTPQPSSP